MKFVKFTKFLGDDFGISSEDLMRALSNFLLRSGYERQFVANSRRCSRTR